MQTIYIVTMWSGGRPGKKWKTSQEPQLLPQGTGVRFTDMETRLMVEIIGHVSIEEYEEGRAEFEHEIGMPPIEDEEVL